MATETKKPMRFLSMFFMATFTVVFLFTACKSPQENGVWIPVPKDTSVLGRIDHFIPVADIETYKKNFGPQRDRVMSGNPNLYIPMSEAFNKQALIDILKDSTCVGIRVYYGLKTGDKQNSFRLILVGINEQGQDLYYKKGSAVAADAGGGNLGGAEYGHCLPPCPGGN